MPQNTRIEQLKAFLRESPDDTFLNYALATEYVSTGDDDKAKVIFLTLIQHQPGYTPSYYHLGKLYERNNKINEAREIYEKGVDICRRNKEQKNLAEMQTALTNLLMDD